MLRCSTFRQRRFCEIYETPTVLNYSFNAGDGVKPQVSAFLENYRTTVDPTASFGSTAKQLEAAESTRSMFLLIGGLIGGIMAFAGLVNFTNLMITSIISRRSEFAAMRSIGMSSRQLRRLVIREGFYYCTAYRGFGAASLGGSRCDTGENRLRRGVVFYIPLYPAPHPCHFCVVSCCNDDCTCGRAESV